MEEIVETVAVEAPFDGQAIVDKFREFRDRSKKQFDENYDSMREDRAYLNGQTQWDKKDSKYVSKSRYRQTLNIIKNNVNSVVNQYSVFPFTFYTGEPEDDQLFDAFMKRPGNSVCGSERTRYRPVSATSARESPVLWTTATRPRRTRRRRPTGRRASPSRRPCRTSRCGSSSPRWTGRRNRRDANKHLDSNPSWSSPATYQ